MNQFGKTYNKKKLLQFHQGAPGQVSGENYGVNEVQVSSMS